MKKIVVLILFILGILFLYFALKSPAPTPPSLEVKATPIPTLEPSPIPTETEVPTPIEEKKVESKRQVWGQGMTDISALEFINTPTENWKEKALETYKRVQPEDTVIRIDLEESGIMPLPGKRGRYLEKVLVTMRHADGRVDRFNALIDSQTGEVVRTFNYDKREHFEKPKGLSPTGTL